MVFPPERSLPRFRTWVQAESGQKAWVCEEVRGGAEQVLEKPVRLRGHSGQPWGSQGRGASLA